MYEGFALYASFGGDLVHHLSLMGFFTKCGLAKAKWHISLGTFRHTSFCKRCGTKRVINLQCLCGCKSQTSEGFCMVDTIILFEHSSGPGTMRQLSGAQIFRGTFLHQVLGKSFLVGPCSTKVVLHSDSNHVLHTISASLVL